MEPPKFNWISSEYLDSSDMNRIESWSKALSNQLNGYGYLVNFEERGSKWEPPDIPSVSDMNRIKRNIQRLRDGYFSIPEWREMIYDNQHDYNRQNAMEWDLQTCYNWFDRMIGVKVPSGVYSSGYVGYFPEETKRRTWFDALHYLWGDSTPYGLKWRDVYEGKVTYQTAKRDGIIWEKHMTWKQLAGG